MFETRGDGLWDAAVIALITDSPLFTVEGSAVGLYGEKGLFGGEAKRERLKSLAGAARTLGLRPTELRMNFFGDLDSIDSFNGVL